MQDNQLRKNNKGVTLVEVIAVIAVLGVVMAAVTGFMITGARMSAQVSNAATVSSREQAGVEFINQRLWEAEQVVLDPSVTITDNETIRIACLVIDGAVLKTEVDELGNSKVTYNGVLLCEGTIYFAFDDENNTVITYYLNENKHVVCLRGESATIAISEG